MSVFGDWDKIMEKANANVFVDWVKTKVLDHIWQSLNDSATKEDLGTLIDECDKFLRDHYGQKEYYDSLDRYVHNGKNRHDICGDFITSGFYSTLISVFVYCDDRCRGERNFTDYHFHKMKKLYLIPLFGRHGVKKFFLYCYNAFKEKFATPSSEDRPIVNAVNETTVNEAYNIRQVIQDESQRTQNAVEELSERLDKIYNRGSGGKGMDVAVQESSEIKIHDDNSEYQELYQDTLFLEAELDDNKKATLKDTYVKPRIASDKYNNFDLEKWVQDRDSRILLLYGKAGIGKTSFVSWLAFEYWLMYECHILKLRDYIGILDSSNPWESVKKCFKCENENLYQNAVLILDGLDEVCVLDHKFDGYKFIENLRQTLRTGFGRYIRVIVTSRMGYFKEITRDFDIEKATITWDETSVSEWCDSYCNIHTNRTDWCKSFKKKYSALYRDDKRREVFCSPIILYICCVSRIDISEHSSVASIYNKAFRMIGRKEYHVISGKTGKEFEINWQFTKEIAFQMFLNEELGGVLESDWVNIAKEKTIQWGQKEYGDEDINPEFNKIFALNHFAFKKNNAVEFAHKTVGEYFTATKFYEDYFKLMFNAMKSESSKEIPLAVAKEVWRSIFNAFRYNEIPPDIMTYLKELIESEQSESWKQKFFKSYYMGLTEQFLVVVANEKSKHKAIYIALIKQIQLAFRNLTWLLTMLGFSNDEFNNTEENLAVLSSYLDGDVCLKGWKKLEGIDLSMKNLVGANFSGCGLNTSNFSYSRLNASNFWNANLKEADFSGAYLGNAILKKAHIERANFFDADLQRTELQKIRSKEAHFQKANFKDAMLQGAHFEEAELQGAHFENARFQNAHFENAKFQDAHFKESQLGYAHFENAQFQNAHFKKVRFEHAHFENTQLQNAHFEEPEFKSTHFEGACLNNANLVRAHFMETHLEQASLENVHLEDFPPVHLVSVFLFESDLPKYDNYIRNRDLIFVRPIIATDDNRKLYNTVTNRMEIEEE